MTEWKAYIISLAVGLLVGIERENSKADQKALGVRTFLLISLLGSIAGDLNYSSLTILISGLAFVLIFTSYALQVFSKNFEIHLGLTTEFAAAIVFMVGFVSHTKPILAATLGPIVAFILFSKSTLHRFTHTIKPLELKTAIVLLLIAAVIIDLTPNSAIDPWGIINPRKFGYLVLILATLEFSSYILLKVIGEKKGSLVVGFLGGLVSSTAVLISSARQAVKTSDSWRPLLCTVLIAQLSSLIELLIITLLISQSLFMRLITPLAAALVFCTLCLVLIWRKQIPQNSELSLKSPLDWKGVFRLSIIFSALLIMISAAEKSLGQNAIFSLSFLSGLFELQGISLANATLFNQAQISAEVASHSILLAVIASLSAKVVVSFFFGRNKFAVFLAIVFIPMIALVLMIGWSS